MNDTRFLLILSIVFLLFNINESCASPDIPRELIDSTVLLRGKNGSCGSGFIAKDGYIYTNAHVAESVCSGGDCSQVRLFRATEIGGRPNQEIDNPQLSIHKINGFLDFAILKTGNFSRGFLEYRPAQNSGTKLYSLGFPRCSYLTLSEGEIEKENSLQIKTSIKSNYGSSGSAVFYENFNLAGLIRQAASVSGAIGSSLIGKNFDSSVIPFASLENLSKLSKLELVNAESSMLIEHYVAHVRTEQGIGRLFEYANWEIGLGNFLADATREQVNFSDLIPLTAADQDLSFLVSLKPNHPLTPLQESAEQLFVMLNLEERSLNDKSFGRIDVSETMRLLSNSPRSSEHLGRIEALFNFAIADNYPGIEITGPSLLFTFLTIALSLLMVWSASLGYVFAQANGGVIKRLFTVLLVAVLFWPISLWVYSYRERRLHKSVV